VGFLSRLFGRETQQSVSPLSVSTLHAGGLVAVVGESHRQEALRAVAKTTTDATPFLEDLCDFALEVAQEEPERRWFRAVLVREPDNPHDSNAVAVYAEGGKQLGYLSREHASAYHRVFESLVKRGYKGGACPAMLMGGGHKSYGVVLALSSPGHVMGDLHADER
jgi:HIRAN domain